MEIDTMGRVVTEATIENLEDIWGARRGQRPAGELRRVVVDDALVDNRATTLSIPTRIIKQLGLNKRSPKPVTSSIGLGETSMYDAVRLTIQGRDCTVDVIEVPDEVPVLIGQIPLEILDLVVDLRAR